jgi:aryl-alcohol dehydrogenase-like predicted oxidoreductase
MEHRILGNTGVRVTSLCLGTMMFGRMGNTDHGDCIRIIQRALDAGINFIDTADAYSRGESEEIVGKALGGGRRHNVVLATKFHCPMGEDPNEQGNSRRWIMRAVEGSLHRLKTDCIDLYQVHRPSEDAVIDETLSALDDLVRQGKVRYIGSSTFPASQIMEAQWIARERRLTRFVCEQPPYSMLVRGIEADVLPACLRHRIGVVAWSPLAGGWLSGKWRKTLTSAPSNRWTHADLSNAFNQRKLGITEALAALAAEAGLSLIHMALAFVLRHPAITAAVIGPRTLEHLESQLGASEVRLSDAVLDRIDALVTPGTNVHPGDSGWDNPGLAVAARRRP